MPVFRMDGRSKDGSREPTWEVGSVLERETMGFRPGGSSRVVRSSHVLGMASRIC